MPGVKQLSFEAKSCVSAGLKSSLGLNNKQKKGISVNKVQKQSRVNQRKGDKEEGGRDKERKMRLMYAKSTPDKIILRQWRS